MNGTIEYLKAIASLRPGQPSFAQFVLDHGRAFSVDERTFKGKRMTPKECFTNATKMVMRDPSLTYVEGYTNTIIPIQHAWVMRPDGSIIDPTLRVKDRDGDQPRDYFGVPFSRKFLFRFLREVRTYGLLDGMSQMSIDLVIGNIGPNEFLADTKLEAA